MAGPVNSVRLLERAAEDLGRLTPSSFGLVNHQRAIESMRNLASVCAAMNCSRMAIEAHRLCDCIARLTTDDAASEMHHVRAAAQRLLRETREICEGNGSQARGEDSTPTFPRTS